MVYPSDPSPSRGIFFDPPLPWPWTTDSDYVIRASVPYCFYRIQARSFPSLVSQTLTGFSRFWSWIHAGSPCVIHHPQRQKLFHVRSWRKSMLVQQDRKKKLLLGFVAVATWIGQSFDRDLFKLLHGFLALCQTQPRRGLTKNQDFEAR